MIERTGSFMDSTREADFKIGEWWVRPQLGQLEKGEASVRVEARSMDVLVCLARQAPGVASKQRILEEVWGDAFVGDEVVSHAIWELRKALDDDARDPLYIQTLPRKGYRLLAEVRRSSGSGEPGRGARIGRYEIERELGNGAMGVVYKAVDRSLGRTVALKFLAPELTRDETARRRFEREARLAASLDHPNLATVHEIAETAEGRQYIVTAFYGGGSLKQRLSAGRCDPDGALQIALQLGRGLAAAHRSGIVHRDVKPANVLLTEDATVKLVDFGIAKLASGTRLTRTGGSLGTPAYKSPEQSRGEEVDQRSDVWSLGVVLYELVSGRLPFAGEYEHAVVRAILEDDPPPLRPDAPEALERVVRKALAKDPAKRYPTAAELVADLEAVERGEAPPRGGRAPRAGRKWLAAALAGVALGAVLVVGRGRAPVEKPLDPVAVRTGAWLKEGRRVELDCGTLESRRQAEGLYRRALALDPENPRIQAQLAILLTGLPAGPGGEAEIRGLVEGAGKDPKLGLARVARARLSLLRGDPASAEVAARQAVELTPASDPDGDLAYVALGEALIALGRGPEGLAAIRRGVERGHGYVRANLVLAYRLWDLGELSDAAGAYEELLKYNDGHCAALSNLGTLYLDMGRFSDALPKLNRALERAPDPSIANNRGMVYLFQGEWEKALGAFRQAMELDPALANPYAGLGDSYEALGDLDRAKTYWEKAVATYDREVVPPGLAAEHRAQRSVYAAKLGRLDEARAGIASALAQDPNSQVYFCAAQLHALLDEREEVYAAMRRAIAGMYSLALFEKDPCFRHLQDDPGFRAILSGSAP